MSTRHQFKAIRATAASLIAQLEALEQALGPEECQHENRDRRVASFDAPERWMCKDCGVIGGEPAAKETTNGG